MIVYGAAGGAEGGEGAFGGCNEYKAKAKIPRRIIKSLASTAKRPVAVVGGALGDLPLRKLTSENRAFLKTLGLKLKKKTTAKRRNNVGIQEKY